MIMPVTYNNTYYHNTTSYRKCRNITFGNSSVITETINPGTIDIDRMPTLRMLKVINDEDQLVAQAVKKELPSIAEAMDMIAEKFFEGGRLFYFGIGASGRIAVQDAIECPVTFGVSKDMIQGIIAGGDQALKEIVRGVEDNFELGAKDANVLRKNDVCMVISASGNPKYLLGVLSTAKQKGVTTIALTCNPKAKILQEAIHQICVPVGPEVIEGSSRLKAATAQKMILNMMSTGLMVKMGNTYGNRMVGVVAVNKKLEERAIRIVSDIACTNRDTAREVLINCDWNVKKAILVIRGNINKKQAQNILDKCNGFLKLALHRLKV